VVQVIRERTVLATDKMSRETAYYIGRDRIDGATRA
jgi:hypothetical protein